MLKKAFRVTTAFALLVAGYAAYAQVFVQVAQRYGPTKEIVGVGPTIKISPTGEKARKLAIRARGPNHWSTDPDLPIRIYNADRSFWMYAPSYKRLEGGKVLEFSPCLMISESRDGKSLKTIEGNLARVELDRPFGLVAPSGDASGGSMKVVRARLEGDVIIRDDKGTPNPADDMRITRLTHLVYDDAALTITSESDLQAEDGDYWVTAIGLLLKLRPKDAVPGGTASSTGFNGVQTLILHKKVHVKIRDVGATGILPGTSAPATTTAKAPAKGKAKAPTEPTPLDVHSSGPMQVDMPKPPLPVAVGPPAPEGPTYVHFERDVEVLRGVPTLPRDSLNCDNLDLTLVPANKPPKVAAKEKPAPEGEGVGEPAPTGESGTNLALKRAVANGHNVHLVSPSQGIKGRCNELIHNKFMPAAPDQTYLRGDATTRLIVEKEDIATDGPDKGKVIGYTLIHTIDATIFDDGSGNDNATIIARGPGDLEARTARDQPLLRTARWEDQLTLQSVPPRTTRPGEPPQLRKRLTLTGKPGFNDLQSRSTLDAQRVLVVWLAPKASPPVANAAKTDPGVKKSGGLDIDELVALGDVQLTSPGKTLTARDRLDAVFESPIPTVIVDAPNRPVPVVPAPPNPNPSGKPTAKPGAEPAKTPPEERPEEPEARAIADRIWAKILLKPAAATPAATAPAAPASNGLLGGGGGGSRAEVDTVFLRGGVQVHQDPEAGKVRGTDIKGEAVDVFKTGENTSKFIVFEKIPPEPGKALDDKNKAVAPASAPAGDPFDEAVADALAAKDPFANLARIDTEDMIIRGQVIGLDQAIDYAWVDGLGAMTQLTSRGLLSDKAEPKKPIVAIAAAEPKKAAVEPKKGPMTVSFARGMKFYGRWKDPFNNRPAGMAEFYEDVHAWTDDGSLDCAEIMRVYLDRVVKLVRPPADTKAPGAGTAETQADVAWIECIKDVIVVNAKLDPETGDIIEKQRIVVPSLIYEKATGKFAGQGPGEVFLYQLAGQSGSLVPGGNSNSNPKPNASSGRVIRPTAGPQRALDATPAPVVSRNTDPNAALLDRGRTQIKRQIRAIKPPPPQLELTQIYFTNRMYGRFGTGQAGDTSESRFADFFGDVDVLRAKVPDTNTTIDPDNRPIDTQAITSQILRVRSEPTRDPKTPQRYLMRAWEDAYATSEGKTIQADTITYDSLDGKFWAYGEDEKEVVIAEQTVFGQPGSTTRGRAAMYNSRDGQAQLVEPSSIAWINRATGERPTVVKPKKDDSKIKRPPRAKFRTLRGNFERNSFTGR